MPMHWLEEWPLVVRMTLENSGEGYGQIASTLAKLGYHVSDQTTRCILTRRGLAPMPESFSVDQKSKRKPRRKLYVAR